MLRQLGDDTLAAGGLGQHAIPAEGFEISARREAKGRGTSVRRKDKLASELGPVLERLLAAREQNVRDRILLEGALEHCRCAAAELWAAGVRGWRPVLSLGDHGRLPPRDRVLAYLEGRLAEDLLPLGEQIVRSPRARSALALGGAPECETDELEALLLVRDVLSVESKDDGAEDREPPPFPADASHS
ncbi:MAG: hypothetical protein HOP15_04345 [Planctomycetes bacterium]|nr:hypothetical protein [Planctomycetota bacterium]